MGWFLRSGGKKRKRSRSGPKSPYVRKPWDPEQMKRGLKIGLWLIVIALVTGAWVLGQRHLKEYVSRNRTADPQIVLHDAPAWMSPALRQELCASVASSIDADPMNHDSLQLAANLLQTNPWIEQVEHLVRDSDGQIQLHAAYRQPVALIEYGPRYLLCDANGRRLPAVYTFEDVSRLGLAVIVGVPSAPPRDGQRWPGKDVTAALRVAALVAAEPFAEQVRAVDVANYGNRLTAGRAQIRLLTDLGRRGIGVNWGRAPGQEQFYEADTKTKLRHLRAIHRKYGSIDAGGRVVDVFGDRALIRSPDDFHYTSAGE